jgi:hypothetical protein
MFHKVIFLAKQCYSLILWKFDRTLFLDQTFNKKMYKCLIDQFWEIGKAPVYLHHFNRTLKGNFFKATLKMKNVWIQSRAFFSSFNQLF